MPIFTADLVEDCVIIGIFSFDEQGTECRMVYNQFNILKAVELHSLKECIRIGNIYVCNAAALRQ